ncbi:phosphoacetylglucosamine mutase [Chloropicon primus]|uniref:Phosphoacetylglucosamine mutase n=1 Tax=Chloropicon primus TaxID=1764295 RepID=A0A5B8N2G5_9CHLO|nr:phosphoacetylglucosamine mutase [Chloropicon primus]|eukprot:QDZ26060.1 phosphoacetylglucosamine mutase [Chloropicon primus]
MRHQGHLQVREEDDKFFRELWKTIDGEEERRSRVKISYGTAGFRRKGETLRGVAFRCGLLAGLRSRALDGKATGLVVTASHNPVEDNGIKLVDGDGGMLHISWEKYAEEVVAAQSSQELQQVVEKIVLRPENTCVAASGGVVLLARDTRPTGEALIAAAIAGVKAAGCEALGSTDTLRTTPQLHWQVLMKNCGKPSEESDYFDKLREGCSRLLSGQGSKPVGHLIIDCANGVGALKAPSVVSAISNAGTVVTLKNTGGGVVNHLCGADYVQKEKVLPETFVDLPGDSLCLSLDGDADRVVFFLPGAGQSGQGAPGSVDLLDGDKILCLIAAHLKSCLSKLDGAMTGPKPSIGVIQTAYANGSSTRYLEENLGLSVVKTKTGVKHLHHSALAFDVSVYFEANGHGTVLFSESFLERLRKVPQGNGGAMHLLELSDIVNPSVGDALSMALLVYVILTHKKWTHREWCDLYRDVPSRMLKCVVPDRSQIKTTNAEQQMLQPQELQVKVDELVSKASLGRAFVRPSGTEDIVRIYAEAETQQGADQLAQSIMEAVRSHFHGGQ